MDLLIHASVLYGVSVKTPLGVSFLCYVCDAVRELVSIRLICNFEIEYEGFLMTWGMVIL